MNLVTERHFEVPITFADGWVSVLPLKKALADLRAHAQDVAPRAFLLNRWDYADLRTLHAPGSWEPLYVEGVQVQAWEGMAPGTATLVSASSFTDVSAVDV
jgi:hypothetical protein